MKCLDTCGWQEMPNNMVHLKRHLEACNINGAWSREKINPIVVWRDGGFAAVLKPKKNERIFETGIIYLKEAEPPMIVPAPGSAPLDVEPVEELQGVHLPPEKSPPNETRIIAEFDDPTEEKPVAKKPRRKKVN